MGGGWRAIRPFAGQRSIGEALRWRWLRRGERGAGCAIAVAVARYKVRICTSSTIVTACSSDPSMVYWQGEGGSWNAHLELLESREAVPKAG